MIIQFNHSSSSLLKYWLTEDSIRSDSRFWICPLIGIYWWNENPNKFRIEIACTFYNIEKKLIRGPTTCRDSSSYPFRKAKKKKDLSKQGYNAVGSESFDESLFRMYWNVAGLGLVIHPSLSGRELREHMGHGRACTNHFTASMSAASFRNFRNERSFILAS